MIVNAHLIGRFGNQIFAYAYARAYAEHRRDYELRTNAWAGQQLFEGVNEGPLTEDGMRLPDDYRQRQRDLIYTKAEARRWFQLRPEWKTKLAGMEGKGIAAHRRVGDYAACGYPVISERSYSLAAISHRLPASDFYFVTEEQPRTSPGIPSALSFLPDFYFLMTAPFLMRGNSCFSWWAATLSDGRVFSPVIDGLEGGHEHDVEFVEGNWPRLSNHHFVTELRLSK